MSPFSAFAMRSSGVYRCWPRPSAVVVGSDVGVEVVWRSARWWSRWFRWSRWSTCTAAAGAALLDLVVALLSDRADRIICVQVLARARVVVEVAVGVDVREHIALTQLLARAVEVELRVVAALANGSKPEDGGLQPGELAERVQGLWVGWAIS